VSITAIVDTIIVSITHSPWSENQHRPVQAALGGGLRLIAVGKKTAVVIAAIAREMAAFLWAIGRQVVPLT